MQTYAEPFTIKGERRRGKWLTTAGSRTKALAPQAGQFFSPAENLTKQQHSTNQFVDR